MRVLLIEDDPATAQSIELMLRNANLNVYTTDLGEEGIDLAKLYDYDLIILDLGLPDMTGYDVLKKLRVGKIETPILILSGEEGTDSKVRGFGSGADDYLTKPFDMDELEARVRALSRRRAQPVETMHSFGGLVFNLQTRSLSGHGGVLDLPRREVAVIDALMTAQGRVVAKADLIEQVYGTGADVEESAIEVHVSRLRKRLRPHGVDIRAQRGLGYRLVAI